MAGIREQQAIDTRKKLIDAAAELFSQYPIAQVRNDWIAARAGFKFLTLYRYFASKESIFTAVVEAEIALCTERISAEVAAAEGAAEKLRVYIRARLKFSKRLIKFRYHNAETLMKLAAVKSAVESFDSAQLKSIESIVDEGRKSGEFAPVNTAETARTIGYVLDACDREYYRSGATDDVYLLQLVGLGELFVDGLAVKTR
jgi:AcrR family transcriptional regulator